jgi:hypothetical protein
LPLLSEKHGYWDGKETQYCARCFSLMDYYGDPRTLADDIKQVLEELEENTRAVL